jgi:ribosomal protein S18 acetylase RimI-like enzyme
MDIRPKSADDQDWIRELLTEHWGGTQVVAHGERLHADALPALVAGDRRGLATYRIAAGGLEAELVTLDAAVPGRGAGTALIKGLVRVLRAQGVAVLRVTTTNDNLGALRFYQRRGFRIVAVRPGAVIASRRLKPGIPEVGEYGIPLRDEIELELTLGPHRGA